MNIYFYFLVVEENFLNKVAGGGRGSKGSLSGRVAGVQG